MSQTAPSPAPLRVVLYSHDSLGLGHLRRNLALAHALAQDLPALSGRDVAGLLVRGLTPGVDLPLPPGFDWLTLPGVAKGPGGYEPRHLGTGTADLLALRSALLETALTCFGPDLVVIDRHPYGVHRELLAPLRRLRRARPSCQVVLGLREVLDSPGCVQAEWHRLGDTGELRHLIDHVWVYGDPAVHDLRRSGEAPTALADRITYTGYLAAGRARTDRPEALLTTRPYVLTTTGGGQDGAVLVRAALGARIPPGHAHVVVAGPQARARDLADLTPRAGTRLLRCLPGLSLHIAQASAVIAMGGYNTVNEVLASTTPALIVPREAPRAEQLIRARALAASGAVDLMRVADLSPQALSEWVHRAVGRHRDRSHLRRDGRARGARLAAYLLAPAAGARGPGPAGPTGPGVRPVPAPRTRQAPARGRPSHQRPAAPATTSPRSTS